jgi:hypothetical protein
MVSQCLLSARMPVVVLDAPSPAEPGFTTQKIAGMRDHVRKKFSTIPVLQFAAADDQAFMLQAYQEGVRAVLPKPSKDDQQGTFIQDTIRFLDAFKSYARSLQYGQDDADLYGRKLKEAVASLRTLANPSDAALAVLTAVSDMFERAVTLVVRGPEMVGERAIGLTSDKSLGPTQADRLKVPLGAPSLFRDVIEKARVFYGESGDDTLAAFLADIGRPLSPAVLLLPLICDRKVVAIVYGDFGNREPAPVRIEMLEILAQQAGLVLEYALFKRQTAKAQKQ